jgi:hypothetical protein
MKHDDSHQAYAAWARHRLDEMDAALTSLAAKSDQLKLEAKAEATRLTAEMAKWRADFEAEAKAQMKAAEDALEASKTHLEQQRATFEDHLKTYVETVGKDIDQKRSTFDGLAAAQAKAWREGAERLQSAATQLGADNQAKAEKALAHVRSQAAEWEAQMTKLGADANASWSSLSETLEASRKTFDEASHTAWDAIKSALAPKKG